MYICAKENMQHQQLKEYNRKILDLQILQIQYHVNNIVQVKYAAKWFEEDASWCRPSVRYLCKTASDGRAASKRGAS